MSFLLTPIFLLLPGKSICAAPDGPITTALSHPIEARGAAGKRKWELVGPSWELEVGISQLAAILAVVRQTATEKPGSVSH